MIVTSYDEDEGGSKHNTIIEFEEGAAFSVTFFTVVLLIIVLAFSVDLFVDSFIVIVFGTTELAVVEELVIRSVVTSGCGGDLNGGVVGSVVVSHGGSVVGGRVVGGHDGVESICRIGGVRMVSGGQVRG